jgi:hypothetical protein
MERKDVIEAIESERDYQIKMEDKEGSHIVSSLNMGGILTAIDYNMSKAKEVWYVEKHPYPKTCEFLRKVAALCLKAGEDHGMRMRDE